MSDWRDRVAVLDQVEFRGCSGGGERLPSRVALLRDLFDLAGLPLEGATVLDCGCGCGTLACVMSAVGARTVHAMDNCPDVLRSLQEYLQEVPPGVAERVVPVFGSATAMPYGSGCFDAVLMIEVASHIIDTDQAFGETLRVLRNGGVLLMSDGNNARNPATRRAAIARWDEREELRPATHFTSYRAQREEWLLAEHSELSAEAARELAGATWGMTFSEVETAYRQFVAAGEVPDRPYVSGTPAVNPAGWYDDRTFDPFELAADLMRVGFSSATAIPYLGRSTRVRRLIDDAFRLLPRSLSMSLARGFRLVAVK